MTFSVLSPEITTAPSAPISATPLLTLAPLAITTEPSCSASKAPELVTVPLMAITPPLIASTVAPVPTTVPLPKVSVPPLASTTEPAAMLAALIEAPALTKIAAKAPDVASTPPEIVAPSMSSSAFPEARRVPPLLSTVPLKKTCPRPAAPPNAAMVPPLVIVPPSISNLAVPDAAEASMTPELTRTAASISEKLTQVPRSCPS